MKAMKLYLEVSQAAHAVEKFVTLYELASAQGVSHVSWFLQSNSGACRRAHGTYAPAVPADRQLRAPSRPFPRAIADAVSSHASYCVDGRGGIAAVADLTPVEPPNFLVLHHVPAEISRTLEPRSEGGIVSGCALPFRARHKLRRMRHKIRMLPPIPVRLCIWEKSGARGRSRTADTAIFSRMLYQLSYLGRRAEARRWRGL